MCLKSIQIINPSKYVSLKYRDPYLLSVGCGKCAECQKELSNQWFFRAWHECQSLHDGYIYFDTLSYKKCPKMNDIFPFLPNLSCFSREDIRLFIEHLRIKVKRIYNIEFRYFLASEYGHDNLYISDSGKLRRGTIRPHYHILFFVPNLIPLKEFSLLVSDTWKHGRTDGLPYKSFRYVNDHNYISSDSLPLHYLRACNYVTKYVQKSMAYSELVENRLNLAMDLCAKNISPESPDDWLDTDNAKHIKSDIKRQLVQFHSQSKHFGESFLNEFDLDEYLQYGCVFMLSPKGLKIPITLSTYYKRKLFYDLYEVDGTKTWQLNELGLEVRQKRQQKLVRQLSDRFESYSLTYNLGISKEECISLADYVLNYRGRIKASEISPDFKSKMKHISLYNYSTQSDKENLVKRGLSFRFLGNNSIGYNTEIMPSDYIPFNEFIGKYVICDETKEKQLNRIYFSLQNLNDGKQAYFKLIQDLENKYKQIRAAYFTGM